MYSFYNRDQKVKLDSKNVNSNHQIQYVSQRFPNWHPKQPFLRNATLKANKFIFSTNRSRDISQVTQVSFREPVQSVCEELTSARVDKNDGFWTQVLRYCKEPRFCSRLHTSRELVAKLNAELSRSINLNFTNSTLCDWSSHSLLRLGNQSLQNVFKFDFSSEFSCLRALLSHQSFYNCPPEVQPCKVPSISHVTWLGERLRFRFHHYISVRSDLAVLSPLALIFWYDSLPTGEWFGESLRFAEQHSPSTRLLLVRRRPPDSIYGRRVGRGEHQTDVVRLDGMIHFGGIYHDLDVVILRSFDPLRQHETTLGHGKDVPWVPKSKQKRAAIELLSAGKERVRSYAIRNGSTTRSPQQTTTPKKWTAGSGALGNGIIVAAPGAYFLRLWHLEYTTFDTNQYAVHSVLLPAMLSFVCNSHCYLLRTLVR